MMAWAWVDQIGQWFQFAWEQVPELWSRTGRHLLLTGVATGAAVAIGIPLGILCSRYRPLRSPTLSIVGIFQTIPSLAMLALLLAIIGMIGAVPAIIALTLYALLPIVRNTLTGLEGVSNEIVEAARGVGMTEHQQLRMVKVPLAVPVIVAGIRTAAIIGVGIATLSTYIGAGGLGDFISEGLDLRDTYLILLGAVPAAVLALIVDFSIWAAEWSMRPTRQNDRGKLRTRLKPAALFTPAILIALCVVMSAFHLPSRLEAAMAAGGEGPRGKAGNIRIGSKQFSEQRVLGELMAQMIEARTNLSVDRKLALGGTMICHEALTKDQIDLYAEYTGTGYRTILERTEKAGPYNTYRIVHDDYRRKYGAVWLEPFGFNNTYAITVRAEDAQRWGWENITDLAEEADELVGGFTSEFQKRDDGYPGMRQAYGFSFGETVNMSPGLMYEALDRGEVDVICAFATSGEIVAYNLKPLMDDRGFFPPYDAAPVLRGAKLRQHPEIRYALRPLFGLLDDATMQRLNYEVSGKKRAPAEVAREFLRSRGLVK